MAKKSSKKVHVWLTVLGLSLLVLLLWSKRESLGETVQAITNANLFLVALLPLLQAANFLMVAKYYQSMLTLFDRMITSFNLWKLVVAFTFVSQILPSGGMSGLAYLVYGLKNQVSGGIVGLVQLSRYVMSLFSYFLIGPLIVFIILLSGQKEWLVDAFNKATHSTQAISMAVGFIAISAVTLFIFTTRKHTSDIAGKIESFINKIATFFSRHRPKLIKRGTLSNAIHEFHDGFDFIRSNGSKVIKPFGFMFMNTFFELSIVYTAFQAVGGEVSIGVLFISFIVAQIVGVVSVIPGDVGVHEGVMILMLSSLGIPDATAISATLLYRVFNKMIYLPLGFFFYSKIMPNSKTGQI